MAQQDDPQEHPYPTGRGYGHDYLRGGELFGGYGYSSRAEYDRRRGDPDDPAPDANRPGDERRERLSGLDGST